MNNATDPVRALGFTIEDRGGISVLVYADGSCHPANDDEVAMWGALESALAQAPAVRVTDEMADRYCHYAYGDMGWPNDFSPEALISNREFVRNGLEAALGQGKANG